MNKKLFTAFLLGASLLSTGSFVSCKDYSDEISDLQTQIDNANKLHATKAELEQAIKDLTVKYEEADAKLADEDVTLHSLINEADAKAQEAQKAADAEKVRATEAEKVLENQITTLKEQIAEDYATKAVLEAKVNELKAADEALQKLIDTKVDATEFKSTVEDIYAKITTCSQTCAANLSAAVAELNSKDAELQAAIDKTAAELKAADEVLAKGISDNADAIKALDDKTAEADAALLKAIQENYAVQQAADQALSDRIAKIESDYLTSVDKAALQAGIDANVEAIKKANEIIEKNAGDIKTNAEKIAANEAAIAKNAAQEALDIQAVKDQIAAVQTALEAKDAALQDAIDKLSAKEASDYETLDGKITLNSNAIAANKAAIEDLATKMDEINTDLKKKIEANTALITKNAEDIATNAAAIAKNAESITTNEKAIAANSGLIKALQADVTTIQGQITAINSELDALNVLVTTSLRSLVFIPDSYYWGVEATEINYLEYQAYEVSEADATKADDVTVMGGTEVRGHEHGGNVTDGTKVLSFAANYHMNPASADLDGATIELLSADKEYVRTATEADALLSITGWSTKDGDLTVNLDAQKPELIKEVPTNKAITVFAVQATLPAAQQSADKDATVTSDYATLYRSNIKGLVMGYASDRKPAIANTHCPGYEYYKTNSGQTSYACDHLFANEEEALANAAAGQYTVDYNSQLPLEGIVETHYTDENGTHMLMTADKLTACGLSYKYELVGATAEATDPCASIDADNNVVINKKAASIGKDVVVRVSLVDAEGTVYDYGYIVILVTDKTNNPVLEEPGTPIEYHSQCATDDYVQTVTTATLWSQLSAGQTIDEAYFAREYDTASATGAQYAMVSATEWKALDADKYIGTVTYDAAKKALVWTIDGDWIRENFYHKNITSATLETYVKLASKNSVSHDVYVHFVTTITVDESNGIAFYDADKISNYWYATNGNGAAATGYDEIHAQTLSPEDAQSEAIGYARDLDDTFSDVFANNHIAVSTVNDVTPGKEFADDKLALDLIFSDKNNGKVYKALYGTTTCTYTVKVADEGKSLVAYQRNGKDITAETVAIITGTEVKNMKVEYQHGTAAEGLLNYARHDELSNDVLAAKIALIAQSTTDCHHVLNLTQNEFDVRFLRPINIITKDLELEDAADSKQIIYLSDLIKDMTDWRDYSFADHTSYWKYYNIKSIKVLGSTNGLSINKLVNTDMNGKDIATTKLSDVSDQVLLTGYYKEYDSYKDIDPSDLKYYGYIEYQNLSSAVREFTIRIPLAVTYEWGTVVTSADVKIKSTHDNAKKR